MKKILKIVAVVLLVVVIVVVVLILNLGSIVKAGVEVGGSTVLGVPVKLGGASVSLLGGSVTLKELSVGNMPGFEQPEMFKVGRVHLAVDVKSLRSETIGVDAIQVNAPELTLEFGQGTTNWGMLLESLKKPPETEEQKKKEADMPGIVVKLFELSDTKVRIAGLPVVKKAEVPMPTLKLKDLGTKKDNGIKPREFLTEVVSSITDTVTDLVKDIVPLEELGKIKGEVGETVKKGVDKVKDKAGEVGGKVKDLFK